MEERKKQVYLVNKTMDAWRESNSLDLWYVKNRKKKEKKTHEWERKKYFDSVSLCTKLDALKRIERTDVWRCVAVAGIGVVVVAAAKALNQCELQILTHK